MARNREQKVHGKMANRTPLKPRDTKLDLGSRKVDTSILRPAKKQKLELDDDDSEGDTATSRDNPAGGDHTAENGFRINEEYARRFEHNKKREERHRCESS